MKLLKICCSKWVNESRDYRELSVYQEEGADITVLAKGDVGDKPAKDTVEGFQVFRMLDKEHQKEAMAKLNCNLRNPVRVDFIKANTIANKAVSNKHGYSKMLKKGTMSPQMLVDREPILEDTVELISVNEKFGLGISVSKAVYQKYSS